MQAASALARTSSDLAETGVAIEAVSSSEGLFQLREGEEGESDLLRPKPGVLSRLTLLQEKVTYFKKRMMTEG